MDVLGTTINNSLVYSFSVKEELEDIGYKAVGAKDGGVGKAKDGEVALGIVLPEHENLLVGENVTIQIGGIGKIKIASKIDVGDPITVDAEGLGKKATTGNFILGYALTEGTTKNSIVQVQIMKGHHK